MDEQIQRALNGGEFKHLLECRFNDIRKKYDLRKVDIEVLYFLSNCNNENTPTDIYRRLQINRGHVSQAIDFLCRRNLIFAIPDKKDRRYVHYSVSESARGIIDEIAKVKQDLDRQIFKGISPEEFSAYKKTTEKIIHNIHELS